MSTTTELKKALENHQEHLFNKIRNETTEKYGRPAWGWSTQEIEGNLHFYATLPNGNNGIEPIEVVDGEELKNLIHHYELVAQLKEILDFETAFEEQPEIAKNSKESVGNVEA